MRFALRALALSLSILGATGCGQQGPLVLPEQARPIERIEQPPGGPGGPDQPDDERRDER